MFLHLGKDVLVDYKDILGIFDVADKNSALMKKIKKKQILTTSDNEYLADDNTVSCIVTCNKIYFSNISACTLKKRAESYLSGI